MSDVMIFKYTMNTVLTHSQKVYRSLHILMRTDNTSVISHPSYNGCHEEMVNVCHVNLLQSEFKCYVLLFKE